MQVQRVPAFASPVENLRWLEDQLDVTYSPACCSYIDGTTAHLLLLRNAGGGNGDALPSSSAGGANVSVDELGWRPDGGSNVQSLVDIFGRVQHWSTVQPLQRQSAHWDEAGEGLQENHDDEVPQGQQQLSAPPSVQEGSFSQTGEAADLRAGDGAKNAERSESTVSSPQQNEEAYGFRSFINDCLMLPGTCRQSGGRRKKVRGSSEARLNAASCGRGLQFLHWRAKFARIAYSG